MKFLRSSYYYNSKKQELFPEDQVLANRIEEITEEFPKYGYRTELPTAPTLIPYIRT
jgi:hypothetical protein